MRGTRKPNNKKSTGVAGLVESQVNVTGGNPAGWLGRFENDGDNSVFYGVNALKPERRTLPQESERNLSFWGRECHNTQESVSANCIQLNSNLANSPRHPRTHDSEGGESQLNESSLPLSKTL